MPEDGTHICFCPLKGVIDIIGKKWSLLIINAIGNRGTLRFNTLMKELHGISPKTLSDTLKELQTEGLIRRKSFAEIPPRVEYSLTEEGMELRKAIIPLLQWAATRNSANKKGNASTHQEPQTHQFKGTHEGCQRG
ncbi:MAG: winged helix-turn-helix transcriptional regulator [Candidatus Bathyarchaeia archaeon]